MPGASQQARGPAAAGRPACCANRGRRAQHLLVTGIVCVALVQLLSKDARTQRASVSGAGQQPMAARSDSEDAAKVALMFLTRGPMPLEGVWEAWLGAAAGALPVRAARGLCQRAAGQGQLQRACNDALQGGDAAARQSLFSIYLHAPPEFKGWVPGSLWERSRIAARIPTRWGDHSLATATRALLAAAVSDPRNARFVLLSEADVPLYDPLTTHQQLLAEPRSMINACRGNGNLMERRWSPRMETPRLNATHWRKSNQFFALIREHAELVVQDQEVIEMFERHCRYGFDPDVQRVRDCISDEHYIPTLLAASGREGEVACDSWGVAALDWGNGGGAHPRAYLPTEVDADLFRRMRGAEGVAEAQRSARQQYYRCSSAASPADACASLLASALPPFVAMPGTPKLTARKFPADTAAALLGVFRNCSNGLGMLQQDACLDAKVRL